MGAVWQDIKYAIRMLAKAPGFGVIAILTLGLGIGANSTIFSWINATLLNPIPGMPRATEVVEVSKGGPTENYSLSYMDFKDLRDRNHSFSGMTAFAMLPVSLTGQGKPQRVWGTAVTADYFDVLRVRPVLGRGFLPAEEGAANSAPVAVISYRLWQEHFGGNPSIVGTTIHIDTHPFTIVGVTPPNFQGSYTGLRMDLWLPVVMVPELDPDGNAPLTQRYYGWMQALGRLRPGVSRPQAQAEMAALSKQIADQFPDSHKSGTTEMTLTPLWRAKTGGNAFFSVLLPILMALAGVVLLLACANIANLLLTRSVSRQKEFAVRMSLGAGRARLVRQLLIESLILAALGGMLALGVTVWTAGSFMSMAPVSDLPVWVEVPVDRSVLLATLVISVLTCGLFGMLPALRASGVNPVGVLKDESGGLSGGQHRLRLSRALAVAQISLSLFLLVSAGLFIRSFRAEQKFNGGFNAHNVLLESYDLFPSGYTGAAGMAFDQQVLDKIRALPGVRSAGIANWTPLGFGGSQTDFVPEGYVAGPHEEVLAGMCIVSPGYFSVMEIPILRGRDFSTDDSGKSQKVVIVSQALADRYWHNQDAVGKRLKLGGEWDTVVGIARTSKYFGLNENPRPFIYLSLYQSYSPEAILHVRTAGDPLASASAVSQAIHQLNADLPVYDVATLEARTKTASFMQRMAGTFVGAFGALALVLAAVGIYGVIAYSTRQRTHEIGIRMALGALPRDVLRLVLTQGLRITLLGLGIGLVASLGLGRLMSGLLFGVSASDPLTLVGVVLLLAFVALVAIYIPARRATRVDPIIALRHE